MITGEVSVVAVTDHSLRRATAGKRGGRGGGTGGGGGGEGCRILRKIDLYKCKETREQITAGQCRTAYSGRGHVKGGRDSPVDQGGPSLQ